MKLTETEKIIISLGKKLDDRFNKHHKILTLLDKRIDLIERKVHK